MKKIVIIGIIMLSVMFASFIYAQMRYYNGYLREEERLIEELRNENAITQRLLRETEDIYSDARVERIAREQLGLVRPDEIVFINDAAR